MATRTISRINAALKTAGRTERLYRNLAGGSYYYLAGGEVECSIYCYSLGPEDFNYAASEINAAFKSAGQPAPIQKDPQ